MSPTPNGTDAKEIALYFARMANIKLTPPIVAKQVSIAKQILSGGYTKQEIFDVIDYLLIEKKARAYSLGYVSSSINDVMHTLNQSKEQQRINEMKQEMRKQIHESMPVREVSDDGESTERNRQKARGIGVQSRLREKFNFDMFEGQ